MSDWVPPHASCKYAVIDAPGGYQVVAVHAIDVSAETIYASEQTPLETVEVIPSEILASPQGPIGPVHGYRKPRRIPAQKIMLMAQTSKVAWRQKQILEEEDRKARG